jgi:hypothetical protein
LLARTINPMRQDTNTYLQYVQAAVHGNAALRCTVTPKVYLMLKHVAWQMQNIQGGLGDKMEDWVERLHQMGMRLRQRFCTVQNPAIRANAREKASSLLLHPNVIAHTNATNSGNKRSFSVAKVDDTILTRQKKHRDMGQYKAMQYFEKEGKMNKLTWLVLIFDNVEGVGKGKECDGSAMLCHLENEKREGDFLENAGDT